MLALTVQYQSVTSATIPCEQQRFKNEYDRLFKHAAIIANSSRVLAIFSKAFLLSSCFR